MAQGKKIRAKMPDLSIQEFNSVEEAYAAAQKMADAMEESSAPPPPPKTPRIPEAPQNPASQLFAKARDWVRGRETTGAGNETLKNIMAGALDIGARPQEHAPLIGGAVLGTAATLMAPEMTIPAAIARAAGWGLGSGVGELARGGSGQDAKKAALLGAAGSAVGEVPSILGGISHLTGRGLGRMALNASDADLAALWSKYYPDEIFTVPKAKKLLGELSLRKAGYASPGSSDFAENIARENMQRTQAQNATVAAVPSHQGSDTSTWVRGLDELSQQLGVTGTRAEQEGVAKARELILDRDAGRYRPQFQLPPGPTWTPETQRIPEVLPANHPSMQARTVPNKAATYPQRRAFAKSQGYTDAQIDTMTEQELPYPPQVIRIPPAPEMPTSTQAEIARAAATSSVDEYGRMIPSALASSPSPMTQSTANELLQIIRTVDNARDLESLSRLMAVGKRLPPSGYEKALTTGRANMLNELERMAPTVPYQGQQVPIKELRQSLSRDIPLEEIAVKATGGEHLPIVRGAIDSGGTPRMNTLMGVGRHTMGKLAKPLDRAAQAILLLSDNPYMKSVITGEINRRLNEIRNEMKK